MVDHRPASLPDRLAFNVKPNILLEALKDGHTEVVWLDSDTLITSAFVGIFENLDRDQVVITEEALWGAHDDRGAKRAKAWGMSIGRSFSHTLNTCVLRVTDSHVDLLLAWKRLLESPTYLDMQSKPWQVRPAHLSGDQDVLSALLCSSEFADLPVRVMKRGRDILQLLFPLSFTVRERIQVALNGLPAVIHSQGDKPWHNEDNGSESKASSALQAIYGDTSPYRMVARGMTGSGLKSGWLQPQTAIGRVLIKVSFGSYALAGLPLAITFDCLSLIVKARRAMRSSGHRRPAKPRERS